MMKGLRLFAVISALTLQSISSFTPVRGLQQINQIKKPSPHFSTHLFARHFNDNDFREPTISNFDKMKSLESRLSFIEKTSPATIAGFYEPHLKSFSVRPGSVQVNEYNIRKRIWLNVKLQPLTPSCNLGTLSYPYRLKTPKDLFCNFHALLIANVDVVNCFWYSGEYANISTNKFRSHGKEKVDSFDCNF